MFSPRLQGLSPPTPVHRLAPPSSLLQHYTFMSPMPPDTVGEFFSCVQRRNLPESQARSGAWAPPSVPPLRRTRRVLVFPGFLPKQRPNRPPSALFPLRMVLLFLSQVPFRWQIWVFQSVYRPGTPFGTSPSSRRPLFPRYPPIALFPSVLSFPEKGGSFTKWQGPFLPARRTGPEPPSDCAILPSSLLF